MSGFIYRHTKTKSIIILVVITLIFNLAFAWYFTGLDGAIPDTHLHYSSHKLYEILESYGEEGRSTYLKGILLLDYLYPVAYTLLLISLIYRLSGKKQLSLLPLAVMILDYLENTSIIVILHHYPRELTSLATMAGFFTLFKWIMVGVCVGVVVVLSVGRWVRRGERCDN